MICLAQVGWLGVRVGKFFDETCEYYRFMCVMKIVQNVSFHTKNGDLPLNILW